MGSQTRRNFIQHAAVLSGLPLINSFPVIAGDVRNSKAEPLIIGHGEYKYTVDKSWAKISTNSNPLLNCHEMVQDSKGRLLMIGDHTNNNILVFDKSGKLLDYWGHGYPGGHGLTISKEGGEDFLILVDCGYFVDRNNAFQSQAGQVIKTDINGKIIFNIGHPRTIGVYKDSEPFRPTETAVAPNGDIYVADGYGSDYILQYDSHGKFIRMFGGRNNKNPEHNLVNAHGVVVDTRDKNNPVVICTSREENCFKIFTLDGRFISRLDMPGMYVCRGVIHGENLYAGVCWSKNAEGKRTDQSGFLTILNKNNKVISNPGGTEPVYKNGVLQPSMRLDQAVFYHGHDVCIDEDENVYVCQWNANHTAPVKLTRSKG
ncbi:6-bladed beta-propeller [Pollutibacter soli]|uniref:6-bladed beta-propeller n=1 Tax=Pollutibacter soli TaxID=3034157 RepID=UPI0030133338